MSSIAMDPKRIGATDPSLFLSKAADKVLRLKQGEVIPARIVDAQPDGSLKLSIRGGLIEARSALQLPRNASVLVRVLGEHAGVAGPEVRLQLLEVMPISPNAAESHGTAAAKVQTLMEELSVNMAARDTPPSELTSMMERLLKAMPDDPAVLPRELRVQLQDLLRSSLAGSDQGIPARFAQLLEDPASGELSDAAPSERPGQGLFADMAQSGEVPLRSILENSGVAFEAKLLALADGSEATSESHAQDIQRASQPSGSTAKAEGTSGDMFMMEPGPSSTAPESLDMRQLESDLKASLLRIKGKLEELDKQVSEKAGSASVDESKRAGEAKAAPERVLQRVDAILKDVETYQLLSKLSDSFYSFLPVIWDGLKEGEIAFKRGRTGSQSRPYYCLMNLDFERLGKLTVVAMMQHSEVFVSFKTDNPEFRSVLDENIPELRQMVHSKGFVLKAVNFLGRQEDHLAPFEQLESFEHIINIKI
jgi:hypothetical protein